MNVEEASIGGDFRGFWSAMSYHKFFPHWKRVKTVDTWKHFGYAAQAVFDDPSLNGGNKNHTGHWKEGLDTDELTLDHPFHYLTYTTCKRDGSVTRCKRGFFSLVSGWVCKGSIIFHTFECEVTPIWTRDQSKGQSKDSGNIYLWGNNTPLRETPGIRMLRHLPEIWHILFHTIIKSVVWEREDTCISHEVRLPLRTAHCALARRC